MKIYWYKGQKNVIGPNVRAIRQSIRPAMSQKRLAEKLQLMGYDFDRLTVGRIESRQRFVADYEVRALALALNVSLEDLYENCE